MLKEKKAQVGPTITWVTAFIIIFFIMILFSVASIKLSEKKVDIVIEGSGNLINFKQLIAILNSPIMFDGEEMSVIQLSAMWSADTSRRDENNVSNGNWTGNTAGLVVENIGNVNVTFNLRTFKNATNFTGGTAGAGPQYLFNVTEVESGSCTDQNITFGFYYDVNTSDPGTKVCGSFTALDTDSMRIDVRVVIPSDSMTGELTDTFTATVAQA